jgi:hypothetical protein
MPRVARSKRDSPHDFSSSCIDLVTAGWEMWIASAARAVLPCLATASSERIDLMRSVNAGTAIASNADNPRRLGDSAFISLFLEAIKAIHLGQYGPDTLARPLANLMALSVP